MLGFRRLFSRPQIARAVPLRRQYKRATRAEMVDRAKARVEVEKSRLALARMHEEGAFLAHLRDSDPAKYAALMAKRLGLEADPFAQLNEYAAGLQKMHEVGLIDDPRKPGSDKRRGAEGLLEKLSEALPLLAPSINAWVVQGALSKGIPLSTLVSAQAAPAPAQPVSQAQPQAVYEPQLPTAIAQGQPQPAPAHDPMEDPEMFPTALIEQLSQRDPEAAAQYLVQLPQAGRMVELLKNVSDDELQKYFDAAATQPVWKPIIVWLYAHPDWTKEMIQHVRRLVGSVYAEPEAEAPEAAAGMGF